MVNGLARRSFLLAACTAGCASEPASNAPRGPEPLLTPWRSVIGGFIGPPSSGMPARPTGMFVKLVRPGALALRGDQLLVADVATQRLWRADVVANTLVGIAGAPVGPETALALGSDHSAWVLDPPAGQVLRFARDGRLLQTWRAPTALPSPVGLALADGGATLLLADGLGAQWSETRGPGGIAQYVMPLHEDGRRVSGVNAIALGREDVFVVDRLAGTVLRVRRDGRVLQVLGRGELLQPQAVAVDRHERVFVSEAPRSLKLLQAGQATVTLAASALGVQQIGAIACDGDVLAVADPLAGQVAVLRLGAP